MGFRTDLRTFYINSFIQDLISPIDSHYLSHSLFLRFLLFFYDFSGICAFYYFPIFSNVLTVCHIFILFSFTIQYFSSNFTHTYMYAYQCTYTPRMISLHVATIFLMGPYDISFICPLMLFT